MGQKILLADDSITIQKVIELTFSDEDFELHTVGNGQKAIDEIRSIQPDIVLCDIIMPEKNGYEVCEFIKSQGDLRHIPVLLLTGAFEPFDQERAKAAGCEGFLAKPFEPQTLISKVKELLSTATPPQAGAAPPVTAVPEMFVAEAPPAPAPVPSAPAPQDFAPPDSDQTVMVSPDMADMMPPEAPEPDAAPGLGDAFAVEAGERELALGASDQAMLLGDSEPAADGPALVEPTPPAQAAEAAPVPPAQTPAAGDDIWGDVGGSPTPPAPAPEQDSATLFMDESVAPPAPPAPESPTSAELGASLDPNFTGHDDPDATWQMPSPAKTGAPPAPAADFGEFEDFSGDAATGEPPAATASPTVDPIPMEPQPMEVPMEPEVDPFTPAPPTLDPSSEPAEFTDPTPIPSVNTEATIDPVMASSEAFAPLSPEAISGSAPEPTDDPAPAERQSADVEELLATSDAETSESPFYMAEPPVEPTPPAPMPFPDPNEFAAPPLNDPEPAPVQAAPVMSEPEPPAAPAPMEVIDDPFVDPSELVEPVASVPAPAAPAPAVASTSSDEDALVERIAQRVVDKLSAEVLQEIAWEVVPDLAEAMIKKEIDALKAKMPNSG